MQRHLTTARLLVAALVLGAILTPLTASAAASGLSAASLFADLCGRVGGAEQPPPAYPSQPTPTGNGTVVNIENAGDLDDLLAGRRSTPAPGSVISLASGVYSEARWKSTGGNGIGFAGTAQHPITWYSRQQYGVEVTVSASYRAMQLNSSDAHHRFIGFHLRDGHELFLSEANGTEFFHGRISGSMSGGAWKWRGVEGGAAADGMRFMYNVVSTANSGSNFGRLEGVYIGDGRSPQLLTTRQTNFEISHNCFADAPGGAIDVKANSTNGIIANNLIDSTDHISGGINALPGWHLLASSVRAIDPNVRSSGNRIAVRAHPSSSDPNAGAGIRVNGTWRSTNDTVTNSSNTGIFVLAQANLHLTVTGLRSANNVNGAANRGGSGQIVLESSGNRVDQQGNLLLAEAPPTQPPPPPPTPETTTTTRPTTTRPTTTRPTTTKPTTTTRPTTTQATTAIVSTPAPDPTTETTKAILASTQGPLDPGRTTTTGAGSDAETKEARRDPRVPAVASGPDTPTGRPGVSANGEAARAMPPGEEPNATDGAGQTATVPGGDADAPAPETLLLVESPTRTASGRAAAGGVAMVEITDPAGREGSPLPLAAPFGALSLGIGAVLTRRHRLIDSCSRDLL